MIYDVAVVGAGPAGSYLAYLLAQDGYAVALLDKATFPREKVCGGGISQKTLGLLNIDLSAVVERRIVGAYLTFQNRDTIVKNLDGQSGVTVTRRMFDHLLVEAAIARGAHFFPSRRFAGLERLGKVTRLHTSGGEFQARFVVGADGVFSQVRSAVWGKSALRYVPALEALVYVEPERIDRFEDRILLDFGAVARGYGWIFPKRDHLNVGVFSVYPPKDPRKTLGAFMDLYDVLRSYRKIEYMGSAIPLPSLNGVYHRDGVLLVGDAAGLAESFYGEGIYFAIKSAVLAHRALSASGNASREELYTRLVRREIAPELQYSLLNARMFYSHQEFGFYRMVRSVHVNGYFAALLGGGVDSRECFFRTFATSPYWLWSRKHPYAAHHF